MEREPEHEPWFQSLLVLAVAVSVLVGGCAETKSQTEIKGVSAQDPFYMIDGWHSLKQPPSKE